MTLHVASEDPCFWQRTNERGGIRSTVHGEMKLTWLRCPEPEPCAREASGSSGISYEQTVLTKVLRYALGDAE